jgi:hypothetical protein
MTSEIEPLAEQAAASTGEPAAEDTYHEPEALTRLAGWANTLAWVALAFAVVITGARLFYDFQQISQVDASAWSSQSLFSASMSVISSVFSLVIGFFYFIVLRAISEGIYILMDIFDQKKA